MALLNLLAKLSLDKTGFEAGMNSAGKKVSAFGGALKSQLAGAFGTAALIAYTKRLVDYGGQIKDASNATGASKKSLQEFGYAADQNGAKLEDVTRAFKALSLARQEALADPKSKAAQAFSALDIKPDELKASSLERLFSRIGAKVKSTDFGASEVALLNEVLGKSAQSLLPAFIDGLDKAADEANRLGIVIDDEGIDKLDEMGDALVRLQGELRGPATSAIVAFANALTSELEKSKIAMERLAEFSHGFLDGLKPKNKKDEFNITDLLIPTKGLVKLGGRLKQGGSGGAKQVQEAANEKEAGDLSGDILKTLEAFKLIGFAGDAARVRREFNFAGKDANDLKTKAFKTNLPSSDSLGRIGGTIGGKSRSVAEAETVKQTRELQKVNRQLERVFKGEFR